MMSDRRARLVFALIVVLVAPDLLAGQSGGYGRIEFPTSGAADAQASFIRGVAALHSFEYEEAVEAFREAQTIDREFAMAYWGEAMAHNRTLWLHEDLDAMRAVLGRLAPTPAERAAKAPTPREKAYLAAAEILAGSGDKQARDRAYADVMSRLATSFPDDQDAAAFHALALLATVQRGITGLVQEGEHRHALVGSDVQRQAAAILQKVLDANPEHPGATHYLIHTWDDSAHAARALPVARTYAKIAPASAHALHMPAHIFVQLGLWAEAATSDEAAFAASDAWVRRKGLPLSMRSYHSLSWLQYSYLQQGRFRDAGDTVKTIEPVAQESNDPTLKAVAASMRARQAVETGAWEQMRGRTRFDNTEELFAIGMSAARLGDAATAETARQEIARRATARQAGDRRPLAAIMEIQLSALVTLAAGRPAQAAGVLGAAVEAERRLPPPLGPPALMKSSDELLGELLLEQGRARDAIAHFEAALDRYPNRPASILGLARALQASGDHDKSRRRYRAFLENWRSADPERPELEEARRAVEKDSAGGMAPVVFIATVTAAVGAVIVVRRRRSVATGAAARNGAGARKARRPRA